MSRKTHATVARFEAWDRQRQREECAKYIVNPEYPVCGICGRKHFPWRKSLTVRFKLYKDVGGY